MGHWPRDPAYLAQAVELMSLDADDLERDEAWILEDGGGAIGFYRISLAGESAEIEEFHLEPDRIGQGFGRMLFDHAVSRARERGVTRLEWSCDEYPLGFYLAMGGQVQAASRRGSQATSRSRRWPSGSAETEGSLAAVPSATVVVRKRVIRP